MRNLNHVYEVYTVENGEEIVVDILRFVSRKDAFNFENGLLDEYSVRPVSLPVDEIIHFLLDNKDDLEDKIYDLETDVENLKDVLQTANLFIHDTMPGLMPKAKTDGKKVLQFPVQNRK